MDGQRPAKLVWGGPPSPSICLQSVLEAGEELNRKNGYHQAIPSQSSLP